MSLLGQFFQLKLEVVTTPQVLAEVLENEQKHILTNYLEKELGIDRSGKLEDIRELEGKYRALSIADSSVLELALRKNVTVLSSDGSLRKICQSNGLEVHGFLWIIEQIYNEGLCSNEEGVNHLVNYSKVNSRAPKSEIEKLIQRLRL